MSEFNQTRSAGGVAGEPGPGPAKSSRRLFVKSYGCQMNVYDARKMADVLAPEGYAETTLLEDADLVILNTCHIRERATEKVFSELGKLRALKAARAAEGRQTKIVVAGCVAQAEGEEIFRRQKAVDVVVGPQSYHRLPELVAPRANHPCGSRHRVSRRKQIRSPCRAGPRRNPQTRGLRLS